VTGMMKTFSPFLFLFPFRWRWMGATRRAH
jgi:hypothetical protein